MSAIAIEGGNSTGHGCFPGTKDIGPYTTTSFINGKLVQLRGVTMYMEHSCGKSTHSSKDRVIKDIGGTFFLEGKPVSMVGDELTDSGDMVAIGSSDSFI